MIKKILEFNRIILTMVIIEFFMNGAFGTISPFFAIFILQNIEGGSATVAGFAAAIYWIVKSIFQLPIARWLDKTDGENDEFWALFISYLLVSTIPLMYFFATKPWHIYATQAFFGFLFAWAVPAWYSMFTRHIDKFRIGFEWSLYSVFSVGISTSLAAVGAGVLIDQFGFRGIFLAASAVVFLSALALFSIRHKVSPARIILEKVIPEKSRKMH